MKTASQISELTSKEIIFYGKTELGSLGGVELIGPDGTVENITIYFGPAPDEE